MFLTFQLFCETPIKWIRPADLRAKGYRQLVSGLTAAQAALWVAQHRETYHDLRVTLEHAPTRLPEAWKALLADYCVLGKS